MLPGLAFYFLVLPSTLHIPSAVQCKVLTYFAMYYLYYLNTMNCLILPGHVKTCHCLS
jgi:hypothetical protein